MRKSCPQNQLALKKATENATGPFSDGGAYRTNTIATIRGGPNSNTMRSSDPPPLKWSDLRYVFDIKEDCNGKEAIQA
jgi:hypothetical protein